MTENLAHLLVTVRIRQHKYFQTATAPSQCMHFVPTVKFGIQLMNFNAGHVVGHSGDTLSLMELTAALIYD